MKNIQLTVLDPGHFHAARVLKSMYSGVDSTVNVFAPEGSDVESFLKLVNSYNSRSDNPTSWKLNVFKGSDYLSGFLKQDSGQIVILAGNNRNKADYIQKSVLAGYHVLSDKPMAIRPGDFEKLKNSFEAALKSNVLVYDIMTSRYDIINILERELSKMGAIFGELQKGTEDNPGISKQSTHHFFKMVSGAPLVRPAWFFDTDQQGSGVVDITTHLTDLIQWECFPEQVLDYQKDISVLNAKSWTTSLTLPQFRMVTKLDLFPGYLKKDISGDILNVYSNGEINYTIRGVHAKVSVDWKFEAPPGSSDSYFSIMRGTKANLVVRQGKEQQFKPVLYIEPIDKSNPAIYEKVLLSEFKKIEEKYPGITIQKAEKGWKVLIPDDKKIDHERQFEQVTKTFLTYVKQGKMPEWEVSFMKAKYYTTTKALEISLKN